MRIFVYEFLTGGGCFALGDEPPAGSLLAEGQAMRDALASDFAAIAEVEQVHLLHDARLPPPRIPKQHWHAVYSAADERRLFGETAAAANAAIIIAPEFSSLLLQRVQLAEEQKAKLLSPSSAVVELCSNKQQTCEHLSKYNVPTPRGISFAAAVPTLDETLFPAVLKPLDGAGSQFVRLVNSPTEFNSLDLTQTKAWRLEQFHPGSTVSVALIAGQLGCFILPPCAQLLSTDGRFTYLGGSTPLPPHLAVRATRLAQAVARALPAARGYLGIDMVLGDAENGAHDVVIEINPRLTTSYLGLRQACQQNLAEAMLRRLAGKTISLSFREQTIEFSAIDNQVKLP